MHTLPEPLAMAAEQLLMDRLQLGEELGLDFVESVIRELVEIWNSKINELREELVAVSGPSLLAEQDRQIGDDMNPDNIDLVQKNIAEHMDVVLSALVPVDISLHFVALRNLDELLLQILLR